MAIMSINPLISFLLVLEEGHEKYINKCLNSLFKQTYTNIEIICIDNRIHHIPMIDGLSHPSLRFIKNSTQKTYSHNKNKALEFSKGQFIALINIKDSVEPDFAKIVINTFLSENADIVEVQSVAVDENHNHVSKPHPILSEHYHNKLLSFSDINAYKHLPNNAKVNTGSVYINNIVFSKSFLVNNKLYYTSNSLNKDSILNFQAIRLAKKTVIIPYIGYFYNKDDYFDSIEINAEELANNYEELLLFIKKIYISKCYKYKEEKIVLAKHLINYLVSIISKANIDIVEHINFLSTHLYLSLVQNYNVIDKVLGIDLVLKSLEEVYKNIHVDLWQYLQKMLQTNLSKEKKLQYIHSLSSQKYTVTLLVMVEPSSNDNLSQCIFSIENQSYSYLEIIYLVDKNIIPQQLDLLKSLVAKKSNISILHLDGLNLKNIFSKVSGTYLSFVNSNSILHKHYVTLLILELNIKEYNSANIVVASYEEPFKINTDINKKINSSQINHENNYVQLINKYNISNQNSYNIIHSLSLYNKIIPTVFLLKYLPNDLQVININGKTILPILLLKDIQVFNFRYYLVHALQKNNYSFEEHIKNLGENIHDILENTNLVQHGLKHVLPYVLKDSSKLPSVYKTALIQQYLEPSIIEFSHLLHKYKIHWANIIKEFCIANKIDYCEKMVSTVPYNPMYKGGMINDIKQYLHNVDKKMFYKKNKNNGILICEYFQGNTYMIEKALLEDNIPFSKIDLFAFEAYKPKAQKVIVEKAKEFNIIITDYLASLFKQLNPHQIVINLWKGNNLFSQGFPETDHPPSKLGYSTYNICSSLDEIKNIAYAFSTPIKNVLPLGHPKTDIFFDKNLINAKQQLFFEKHPNFRDKNIYLFVPTFRNYKSPCINLNFTNIHNLLNDNEVLLVKEHPFSSKKRIVNKMFFYNFSRLKSKVFDATHEDINTLVSISKVIISDFSSVMFDAILLNKPLVFYAEDVDKYINNKPILYDYVNEFLDTLISTPNENLFINSIRNARIDYKKYDYLREKYIRFCDGKASKRLLKMIKNIINEIS